MIIVEIFCNFFENNATIYIISSLPILRTSLSTKWAEASLRSSVKAFIQRRYLLPEEKEGL
jgi:hypothetical protein